ncbi:MAG: hypothetical protein ACI9YE_000924, partial [Psychroserpens sp.]
MKNFTTLIFALLFTSASFAQSHTAEITKNAQIYYDYMTA